MIIEELKTKLQGLFPPPPETATDTVEETGEEAAAKEAVAARENGMLECDYKTTGYHLDILTDSGQVRQVVGAIDACGFFLETITGVDWIKENQMEVIYDFSRFDMDLCRVVVRSRIDRSDPVIDTISDIYPGANWHERETHDFFGITFEGHPHLVPLLLPDDADYHPLRKDFKP